MLFSSSNSYCSIDQPARVDTVVVEPHDLAVELVGLRQRNFTLDLASSSSSVLSIESLDYELDSGGQPAVSVASPRVSLFPI